MIVKKKNELCLKYSLANGRYSGENFSLSMNDEEFIIGYKNNEYYVDIADFIGYVVSKVEKGEIENEN